MIIFLVNTKLTFSKASSGHKTNTIVGIFLKLFHKGGFFKGLNDTINGLIGTNGTLTTYEENLTNSHKSLTQSKEQRQKELDTKYTTMAEKWSQYDTIIAKLASQMNTVNGMIEAARNANK